jgi:hypothetical protein
MEKNLYYYVTNAKKNNEYISVIIKLFEPKIKKSVMQTTIQEREDLTQNIKLKLVEKIRTYEPEEVPDFYQFCEIYSKKTS